MLMRVKWSPSGCWNFLWHWTASWVMPTGGSRKQLGARRRRNNEVSTTETSHSIQGPSGLMSERETATTMSIWWIYKPIKRIGTHSDYKVETQVRNVPDSIAAIVNISLTQSNSQDASRAFAIWGSRGISDMMMPISDKLPSSSKAAR